MSAPLAAFTPSLLEPDTLERLFVAREPILTDLVARAAKATAARTRAHRLLVGPRGAGKTHLLSLAHHRIGQLDPAPVLAWLPEDPWMIDGYADLLREILKASSAGDESSVSERRQATFDALERALLALAERDGPIVVLAENFDRILGSLGTDGQRRLRRFMENGRALLLLVTATRLTAGLVRQDGPFYGFFSSVELEPLTVTQAADMLTRIADYRGDKALTTRLRMPAASDRHRLSAIDALAGGQPRVWALLASALTVDGLDSLADVLLTRFDDLTPYYQEQLARLAPQERKVVRTLADLDRALNVSGLAEALGIDQKSLAKTVSTLRHDGWLVEVPIPLGAGDARKTYFELAEPLARLAFQIKDNRGEAIPMLVSFLSTWFSRTLLECSIEPLSAFVHRQLDAALGADDVHAIAEAFGQVPTGEALGYPFSLEHSPLAPKPPEPLLSNLADALDALSSGDPASYLALPAIQRQILRSALDDHGIEATRRLCISLGPADAAWTSRAERLAATGEESILNRRLVADLYQRGGREDEALVLLDDLLPACLDELGPNDPLTLDLRRTRIRVDAGVGDAMENIARYEALLDDSVRVLGKSHRLAVAISLELTFEMARVDCRSALDRLHAAFESGARSTKPDRGELLAESVLFAQLVAKFTLISIADAARNGAPVAILLNELHADVIRSWGRDDRLAFVLRKFIADAALKQDDITFGRTLLEELSEDQARVLGAEHPDSVRSREQLDSADEVGIRRRLATGPAAELSPRG